MGLHLWSLSMVFRLSCFLAQKRVNHKRGGLSAAQPDLYDKAPLYEPVCAYSLRGITVFIYLFRLYLAQEISLVANI